MTRTDNSIYEKRDRLSNDGKDIQTDVIILGAGAAGIFCARTAATRGRRVVVVDHNTTPGRKITVSGGGKANFTNLHMDSSHYVGSQPDFCEAALALFTPRQIMDVLTEHRMAWEEREHGQLFGLVSAEKLTQALAHDCGRECRFLLEHSVKAVEKTGQGFRVLLRHGAGTKTVVAQSLVLALGSPAWPQVGASEAGAELARQWGHKVLPFRPVLVPLRMPQNWALQGLSGISLKVAVSVGDYTRVDDVLFTHTGISGPAALQLSCHWQAGQEIGIDFLPQLSFDHVLDAPENGRLTPRSLLARHMPQRLVDALLPEDVARRKVAELSRAARTLLRDRVHAHRVTPQGHEGLRRAEAAAGGVDTREINAWSMESLLTPGLFVVGELLDVTGHLGGYNLHWAWASGYAAGLNV